ncbi:MAG: hypothetical protein WAL71_06560 [Terriglobales bacterium]|jgi:hypothetical protein
MNLSKAISSVVDRFGRMALVAVLMSVASLAQAGSASSLDPAEVVRKAVQNEVKESNAPSAHFMFRGIKTTPTGSTTRLYVETGEATAGMIVAYDGKVLTSEQRQSEIRRLERFTGNPEELRKKKTQEHDDAERTLRIVRALPDAFTYEYAGEVPGSAGVGRVGDPLVKLKFRPNPNYRPPSHVEEVLTGMEGDLLLDAVHYRIASIDGTLFKEVGFGWGILGHLNRGGHFLVHQEAVEDNLWEVSSMGLRFTGRILLVKSLSIDSTEVFSDFRRVATDLTFAQAVEVLKKQETSAAQSAGGANGGRK